MHARTKVAHAVCFSPLRYCLSDNISKCPLWILREILLTPDGSKLILLIHLSRVRYLYFNIVT